MQIEADLSKDLDPNGIDHDNVGTSTKNGKEVNAKVQDYEATSTDEANHEDGKVEAKIHPM